MIGEQRGPCHQADLLSMSGEPLGAQGVIGQRRPDFRFTTPILLPGSGTLPGHWRGFGQFSKFGLVSIQLMLELLVRRVCLPV